MQCNASYTRFIFGKFFICTTILYAFYMHSYVDKNFILVKSGCYMLSARDVTPSRRGGFRALAAPLKQVVWPEKFKAGHIDKYDGFSNLKEFIQV
jgi:hypothetical protein